MRTALIALAGAVAFGPGPIRSDAAPTAAVFAGSTPCDETLRALLSIPENAAAELVEWEVTLDRDPQTQAPSTFKLQIAYGATVPNLPGLGPAALRAERRGAWRVGRGTRANPAATVFELEGAVSLVRISDTVVHVLDRNRDLMVGNGGWSYTLSLRAGAERPVDPALAAADPGDDGRTVTPLASGPSVFGVFEGRTPCQGIARELRVGARPGCWKAKWRITLSQDPTTQQPAAYQVEGTLHPSRPREGRWRVTRGAAADQGAIVYELARTEREAPVLLLKGDDRVLFFLDQHRRPLAGDGRFAYTLDRRRAPTPSELDPVVAPRDLARVLSLDRHARAGEVGAGGQPQTHSRDLRP